MWFGTNEHCGYCTLNILTKPKDLYCILKDQKN